MSIDLSRMTVHEIFQHISDLKPASRPPAVKKITEAYPAIKLFLMLGFNKSWKLDLPDGDPPYKPQNLPENFGYTRLGKEYKKFNYFLSSKTPQLDPIKREKIFVDFLESLSEEESKVVLMIKDQKFKYKGITRKLLMECIPEIFNGEELGKSNG